LECHLSEDEISSIISKTQRSDRTVTLRTRTRENRQTSDKSNKEKESEGTIWDIQVM
jgi:uncharacterized protein YjaG (DUF416 family)